MISQKLDAIPVRPIVTYKYDDLMIYLGMGACVSMLIIFVLILSL